MDLVPVLLRIHEGDDASGAFRALAESLAGAVGVRAAAYVRGPDASVRDCWPAALELSDDLRDTALHVLRPEVFALGSEFPFDAGRFPAAEMLVLPLRRREEERAACLLIAGAGAFGEDPQPWGHLARALEDAEARHQRLADAERRCEELQRRVEESEALHTLGLAANRTLDKGEVLNLVARFTRTLLGAHYVTVNTLEGGLVYTAASVGVRDAEALGRDYHLARAVVEAEKPLTLGGAVANLRVEDFPLHAAEGMRAGLGIPLSLFGDTFGALIVGYRREYEVTPQDVRLGLTLAGHAAVAIGNARLHESVALRSRELQEAYEQLDALTRAKERFFASINHELRNPVGAVLGYQTLLLDGTMGEIPPAARGYLERAQRAATTLLALVNDILDLSKLAAGKMEVERKECSAAEIVDGVLNTIQPLADQKPIPLVVDLPGELPPLDTDAPRVQQILVNLLSNAVKFTREGEVRIAARLHAPQPEDGAEPAPPMVDLIVSDTGPGIPPDDLKRIFEEYEQVKGTSGGTGLGLPISRRFARLLGGELWAESEPGVGSRFVLRLPAGAGGEADGATEFSQASGPPVQA